MALGNYAKALGGMARESVSGAVKGFGLGIKSAALREMPGFTALYGFSKELQGRAGKMNSGAAEVVKETQGIEQLKEAQKSEEPQEEKVKTQEEKIKEVNEKI